MSIFLDSSAIVAYYNKKDQHHERGVELLKKVFDMEYGLIYTSDYILDESVTVAWMRTKKKKIAINLGERLLFSEINLLIVTKDIAEKTWVFYKGEKNPIFTDCSTVVLMGENGIENVMTFDEWFDNVKGVRVIR